MAAPMSKPDTHRYSYQDYLELPDDGKQYQIVDGELFVNCAPLRKHQGVLANLVWYFQKAVREAGEGKLYFAPFDVVLSEYDVVQPDLLYFSPEHLDRLDRKGAHAAPTLAVEVLSESTRRLDVVKKRRLYESQGVEEYWIVDPAIDSVQIYRRQGEELVRAVEVGPEEPLVLNSPLLPGLEVPTDELFAD